MIDDQRTVERLVLVLGDSDLLPHTDARRHPVHRVAAFEDVPDQAARLRHLSSDGGREVDSLPLASGPNEFVEGQVVPRQEDGHPQTTAAVSAIVRSFASSSSRERAFPTIEGGEPALR